MHEKVLDAYKIHQSLMQKGIWYLPKLHINIYTSYHEIKTSQNVVLLSRFHRCSGLIKSLHLGTGMEGVED